MFYARRDYPVPYFFKFFNKFVQFPLINDILQGAGAQAVYLCC